MSKEESRFSRLVLLLALFLVVPVAAQEVPAPVANRHSLWEVGSKSNVVYILGSIHLLKPTDYPLAKPIETAFSNAPIAVFETDIGEMRRPETQLRISSKAQLPEGQTLKQQLSAEVYAGFNKHLQEADIPDGLFDQFRPAVAAAAIEVIELQKLGLDPEYGVDQYFFSRARREGKQIVPLETVDFQIGLVIDFTREEGELLMKSTLEDIDNTKKLYGEIVTAWRVGDAPKLEKVLNEAMRDAPVIYRRLVTDRNRRWVPKIEELLRGNKNAVVIVGAGHLVGNDGVVELLRKNGWRVTQL